ncbi:hypothetical protein JMJ77_0002563 [Colletotrichum scovillei]|uniref:Uncharacterized protein n=1 Tax=Colletotrichum scovillei TaxID=1209932 RepID=A0A9P7R9V7_9PEZI|nr:hypothetical protein JMJ77_0002563 [Colletotrichum scovillei]KAG7070986.1 hypothetical protein JMJ76_0002226 [Colletotrichum scovillei]KAG7079229.1 hypothetical protein JMJ78_0002885 [Colletotrichum scovillei]
MQSFNSLLTALAATAVWATCLPSSHGCPAFPPSMITFSAGFEQPQPPLIKPDYQASFVQHKWNANLSHITTGYIDNFPSGAFVRVGEAYEGQISWSSFDYSNVSESGLVDNTLTTYGWNSTTPSVWRGYVNSNFPIFRDDILVEAGAVYEGLIRRDFVPSPVAAWSIMYQGAIPVTVYVNECNIVVGYDYFAPDLRTRVIMEFFNIQAK